jgi:hypothetical protein
MLRRTHQGEVAEQLKLPLCDRQDKTIQLTDAQRTCYKKLEVELEAHMEALNDYTIFFEQRNAEDDIPEEYQPESHSRYASSVAHDVWCLASSAVSSAVAALVRGTMYHADKQ